MELLKKIKSQIKGKTLKNGFWLYCAQAFNLICPMLSLPYITRILGAEHYGFFSIALNIITYLQVLVEYGFVMSATRKVAQDDSGEKTNRLFSTVLASRAILLLASIIVSAVYTAIVWNNVEQRWCTIILSLVLIGTSVQTTWLFHGKQNMAWPAIITMIFRVISLACMFIFIKNASDIYLYCFIYASSPLFINIVGLIFAKIKYKVKFVKIKMTDVWKELKDGWFVFTTQMSSKVFSAIGITFLGFFALASETGVFSTIQKIPYVLTLIWAPIAQVFYPVLSKKYKESFANGYQYVKKLMAVFLSAFAVLIVGIAVLAHPIINLVFGQEYAEFYYLVYPLLLWTFFGILNNFLGIQILLASGRDKAYAQCFNIGVVFNVLINLILIFFWKGLGASIAPLCAEAFLTVLMIFKINKIKKEELK